MSVIDILFDYHATGALPAEPMADSSWSVQRMQFINSSGMVIAEIDGNAFSRMGSGGELDGKLEVIPEPIRSYEWEYNPRSYQIIRGKPNTPPTQN